MAQARTAVLFDLDGNAPAPTALIWIRLISWNTWMKLVCVFSDGRQRKACRTHLVRRRVSIGACHEFQPAHAVVTPEPRGVLQR
jgi:hypothetical protein